MRGRRLTPPSSATAVIAAALALVPQGIAADPASGTATGRPTFERPFKPGPDERAHLARYDAAIAPAMATPVSEKDAAALRDAAKAFSGAKLNAGLDAAKTISDPTAVKLATWLRLRNGYGTADEFRDFLDANPAWPERQLLTQRLEEALFTQGGTSTQIRQHFANGGPDNGVGFAALASSYMAEGKTEEAAKYARKAWRDMSLPATLETGFLDRFGKLLTPADHQARLDRLIVDDLRYKAQRASRAAFARRTIALLPEEERARANARLAVFLKQDGAGARIANMAANAGKDWGLVYHHIQGLRRADRISEAARIMLESPTGDGVLINPDSWWDERRALAYDALKMGKPKLAYDLVAKTAPLSVNPLKEQAFMAGWLALRYLKDPAMAAPHFAALHKAADGPLSRSKAAYWLGRNAEARGEKAAAKAAYTDAAAYADTFHGQLAQQKLNPGVSRFPVSPPAAPSTGEIAKFNELDAVKAAVIAHKAKLDRSVRRAFLTQLRFHLKTESEMAMIAHLAEAMNDTQMAVRTAKSAIGKGHNLIMYGYPVHPFPAYSPLRTPPETAFLLGIARQETEFNVDTVSGAGAKGLLQVMTVTAKHVCQDYKIKCDIKRLLTDPAYNTMMASAYIGDRMQSFTGSYVLSLAGYNAGPGRTRQWIAEFGDPRDGKIDPIDWIERIPIQETREYVAKVLSNIQVYRARLGQEDVALQLERDLNRARVASGGTGGGAPDEKTRSASDG